MEPKPRSAFAEILRAWRDYLGLTQQTAADLTGVARSQWSSYEQQMSPTLAVVTRIAAGFEVTVPELLQGPPPRPVTAAATHPRPIPRDVAGLKMLPLWDSLPGPQGYTGDAPGGALPVLAELVVQEDMVLQRIVDDACRPELVPGDVVLVDPSRTSPRSGELVVVEYGGQVMVRRFRVVDRKPHLVPDNPMWPMVDVDSRQLRVLGVVTDLIRRPLDLSHKARGPLWRKGAA